jgi:hypothetical protein
MGDAIVSAAQEVWAIVVDAVTNPGPWLIAALVLAVAVAAALLRGKLASPWLWIPALAAAAFWAYHHVPHY